MSIEYSLVKKLIKYSSADYQPTGVCFFLTYDERKLFLQTIERWEYFSGSYSYPVPTHLGCKNTQYAIDAYDKHANENKVGNHEYGKARHALIKFVLEELEPKLNSWEQFKLKVYKKWRNYE